MFCIEITFPFKRNLIETRPRSQKLSKALEELAVAITEKNLFPQIERFFIR